MIQNTQNLLWAVLTIEERESLRLKYKSYGLRNKAVLKWIFGYHNLTSDKEPEEMLYVRREDVIQAYLDAEIYYNANHECSDGNEMLEILFGKDKCLPDTPQPKFNVGDIVKVKIGTYGGSIMKILNRHLETYGWIYDLGEKSKDIVLWFNESDLETYTEPEKENDMEENKSGKEVNFPTKENKKDIEELNLCKLLSKGDLLEEEFYSPAFGKVTLSAVIPSEREVVIMDIAQGIEYSLNPYGCLFSTPYGQCVLFPSRDLYLKYPLDAYKAWQEWSEVRKSKYIARVEFTLISCDNMKAEDFETIEVEVSDLDMNKAVEAVRCTLENFSRKIC